MDRYRLALNLTLACIALGAVILACAIRSALPADAIGSKADKPAVHVHVANRPGLFLTGDSTGGLR